MNIVTILSAALVGKKVEHRNVHYRTVCLEVESVTLKNHSKVITPDTKENDWYGESVSWSTFLITFTDGSSIEIDPGTEIKIVE